MSKPNVVGRAVVGAVLLALAGCNVQVLQQGEPNFNSAILLPGYDPAKAAAMAARSPTHLSLTPQETPASCLSAAEVAAKAAAVAVAADADAAAKATAATVADAALAAALAAKTPDAASRAADAAAADAASAKAAALKANADSAASTAAAQAALVPSATEETAAAKACVYDVKALIDDQYREYRITLHHYVDDGNAALDVGSLGLGTAATLIGAAPVKTTLSALGTLLTGTKSVINEDVLLKAAIESIINQMDADRQQQFGIMLSEINGTASPYTLSQAKDDLLIYFSDGTWDHALVSMQVQTAANSAACKTDTNNAKVQVAKTGTTTTATTTPSATSACPSAAPTATVPVGITTGSVSTSVPAAGGKVIVVVKAMTDDSVVIKLQTLTAAQIASVTINGKASPQPLTASLNPADVAAGPATVVFTLDKLAAKATFNVEANGMKGTQMTGPTTLGSVTVQ